MKVAVATRQQVEKNCIGGHKGFASNCRSHSFVFFRVNAQLKELAQKQGLPLESTETNSEAYRKYEKGLEDKRKEFPSDCPFLLLFWH